MSQSDSIIMPLGLSELVVVKLETEADDGFTLSVRYQRTSSPCPRCHRSSTKLHDERAQECRAVACAVGRDGGGRWSGASPTRCLGVARKAARAERHRACEWRRVGRRWGRRSKGSPSNMDMSATFRSVVELC
jgi:hypothetical protein